MGKSKVIFTADDFGVDDSINEGTTNLAKWGILDSVEILPNYGQGGAKSVENTLKMLDEVEPVNPTIELGVHFTITSGKPLTKNPGLKPIIHNGFFKSFKYIPSTATAEALREELIAQVEVLKANDRIWKKITHCTNHHDSLWFYPEYTQVYIEVANKYNLPIRSPQVLPEFKETTYYTVVAAKDKPKPDRQKVRRAFKKRNAGRIKGGDVEFKSTNYLDGSYYGLWNRLVDTNPYNPDKYYEKRYKALQNLLARIKEVQEETGSAQVVEALFHVRKGPTKDSKQKISRRKLKRLGKLAFGKYDLPDYNGVDTRYFDGRSIEYMALARANNDGELEKWLADNNVEKGEWKDTIKRRLCDLNSTSCTPEI